MQLVEAAQRSSPPERVGGVSAPERESPYVGLSAMEKGTQSSSSGGAGERPRRRQLAGLSADPPVRRERSRQELAPPRGRQGTPRRCGAQPRRRPRATGERARLLLGPFAAWRRRPAPGLMRRRSRGGRAGEGRAGRAVDPAGLTTGEPSRRRTRTGRKISCSSCSTSSRSSSSTTRTPTARTRSRARSRALSTAATCGRTSCSRSARTRSPNLDRFKDRVPSLFENSCGSTISTARGARGDRRPLGRRRTSGDGDEVTAEPELVDAILDQVADRRVLGPRRPLPGPDGRARWPASRRRTCSSC